MHTSAVQTGTLWQVLTTHYSITYQPVPTCSTTDSTLSTPMNSTAPALKGSTVISIKLNAMNCMNLPHSFHPWFMPLTTGRTLITHTANTWPGCSLHIAAAADTPLNPLTPCVCRISWAHPASSAVMITVVILSHHNYLLTYSMEQSPSWEANWFCS